MRDNQSLAHVLLLAVRAATVAVDAVFVVTLLARIALDDTVTAAILEHATGETFTVAPIVPAVVALLER